MHFLKQLFTRPRWLLYATRQGSFEVFLVQRHRQITSITRHADAVSLATWINENTNTRLRHAQWRVLADLADPVSTCIKLPPLGRADQRAFMVQRLQTHHPEAPWRYAQPLAGLELSLLVTLSDAQEPKHRLEPILHLIVESGQCIEAIVTPGQLLCPQYGQANQTELLILPSPEGHLLTLSVLGEYRFSRLVRQVMEPAEALDYLYPTLLTHHLLMRNQEVIPRVLSASTSPQVLLRQLATVSLSSLPHRFNLPSNSTLRWKHGYRLPVLIVATLASCLAGFSYGGFSSPEASGTLLPSPPPTLAPSPSSAHGRKATPFKALHLLSTVLDQYPELAVLGIRWEYRENVPTPHVLLDIESLNHDSPHLLLIKAFLEKLTLIGHATLNQQQDDSHFTILIKPSPATLVSLSDAGERPSAGTIITAEVLRHWVSGWLTLNTQDKSLFPKPAHVDRLPPPTVQAKEEGSLAVALTSTSDIPALRLLNALLDDAPAILSLTRCTWTLERTHKVLTTSCHFQWQHRSPTDQQHAVHAPESPPIHKLTSSRYPEIATMGTLFWHPKERQPLSRATSPKKPNPAPASEITSQESHGWIKRSDGMVLRWPAP